MPVHQRMTALRKHVEYIAGHENDAEQQNRFVNSASKTAFSGDACKNGDVHKLKTWHSRLERCHMRGRPGTGVSGSASRPRWICPALTSALSLFAQFFF